LATTRLGEPTSATPPVVPSAEPPANTTPADTVPTATTLQKTPTPLQTIQDAAKPHMCLWEQACASVREKDGDSKYVSIFS
jgi:hypothetical protein